MCFLHDTLAFMEKPVAIVGAGLAGSEAALQLASRGIRVNLYEMRPNIPTPVHRTAQCAELVCSNSLKGTKAESAAGMLKLELDRLGSRLFAFAKQHSVPAGGALAVDRDNFADAVTHAIQEDANINLIREEVVSIESLALNSSAVILCTGPLSSDGIAREIEKLAGGYLAFYDAAAPIVMADSLDYGVLFRQSRYEDATSSEGAAQGDYLNAPFTREEYEAFIEELVAAKRVIAREFESKDLFQACQPIEEIARKGVDAPRFGPLKPVGLTDPRTGRRPWAALQLRAEDSAGSSYNLVGFQTNLTFTEQKRVFGMIPGLQKAEFARYGVMHRNTFIDAPRMLEPTLKLVSDAATALPVPLFVAGQLSGTEGYCEAMRSGLHAAISVYGEIRGVEVPLPPKETVFGALVQHATSPDTVDYQPMHVNFGIMPALDEPIRNKGRRYAAYAQRGARALEEYCGILADRGLLEGHRDGS